MQSHRVLLTLLLTAIICFPLYLFSEVTGPEPRRTGGPFPGERSCATSDCHGGVPNTGLGSVSISVNGMPVNQYLYQPGETAPVVVSVSDPSKVRWGFELTARTEDGCLQAGRFSLSAASDNVQIRDDTAAPGPCPEATIQFPMHSFPKGGLGGASYELSWTAPASDIGPVVFAAAGNAANGNNLQTGDSIYTTQATVQPAGGGGGGPIPAIGSGGVVVANLLPTLNSISPNTIITIFGSNFAPQGTVDIEPELDAQGRVATRQRGICVEINGERSPILHVFASQLNLQAPTLGARGPVSVEVITGCDTATERRSAAETIVVQEVTPAFFVVLLPGSTDPAGANPIAALHGGGPDLVFDPNIIPGTRPAEPGEFISLFATGFGPTNPPVQAGEIPAATLPDSFGQAEITDKDSLTITIGGIPLVGGDIFYAGTAPCCVGLYQLVVKVPSNALDGNLPVVAVVAGIATPSGPFIPVKLPQ